MVPLNNHGDVRYITESQNHTINVLQTLAFGFFIAGFLIQS